MILNIILGIVIVGLVYTCCALALKNKKNVKKISDDESKILSLTPEIPVTPIISTTKTDTSKSRSAYSDEEREKECVAIGLAAERKVFNYARGVFKNCQCRTYDTIIYQKVLPSKKRPDFILIGACGVTIVEVKSRNNCFLIGNIDSPYWVKLHDKNDVTAFKAGQITNAYIESNAYNQAKEYTDEVSELIKDIGFDVPINFVLLFDDTQYDTNDKSIPRDNLYYDIQKDSHIKYMDSNKKEVSFSTFFNECQQKTILNNDEVNQVRNLLLKNVINVYNLNVDDKVLSNLFCAESAFIFYCKKRKCTSSP